MEQREGKTINDLRVFTSPEVEEILDLKTERLRQWIKLKYIEPTIKATGSGTKNYFSKTDIYKIALFKKCVDSGINRWIANQVIEQYSNTEFDYVMSGLYTQHLFVAVKSEDRKTWKDSLKLNLLTNMPEDLDWEIVIVINLASIRKRIKNKIM